MTLDAITEDHFDRAFDSNVKGVTVSVQKALPHMMEGSAIVIVGSKSSIQPGPGASVYGGTKAALRAMVRGWVTEIKGSGVRINVVSLGPVLQSAHVRSRPVSLRPSHHRPCCQDLKTNSRLWPSGSLTCAA
ncbi:enoyl-ACP reductase-like protein [Roseinatronobacter bogoriensis subsp. barguzinensis]|uniref:SDR family oxidoreductase n=1 Tax=Roseinatronobacter bogoriensis TaxID=119542 RepID=UPI0010F2A7EE|nr:NAD(P)-dependent dehydrogenase (short-subunit alcohol dehydrogenase family) [Rhodobaca bogoriensis DSM 18756]TDW32491.1 enoyl-ACP reductase-like protein [Rhodobaca barguzinensis]TDY65656.1 enoyl-ACP reductase-like protein [Rhodobaca bogoriensis DSM 18756]